jgi:hypothetical protein
MSQGGIISAVIPFESSADTSNVVLTNVACLASVYVGAIVSLDATGTAFNSLADSETNSNMIGICESKSSTTLCDIRVLGTTTAIFTSLDPSKEYFLSDSIAGAIQTTVPTTSGHIVLKIGQPFSSTRMVVLKGQRSKRL